MKKAGRIRYLGYDRRGSAVRRPEQRFVALPLDFVQLEYSIGDAYRGATLRSRRRGDRRVTNVLHDRQPIFKGCRKRRSGRGNRSSMAQLGRVLPEVRVSHPAVKARFPRRRPSSARQHVERAWEHAGWWTNAKADGGAPRRCSTIRASPERRAVSSRSSLQLQSGSQTLRRLRHHQTTGSPAEEEGVGVPAADTGELSQATSMPSAAREAPRAGGDGTGPQSEGPGDPGSRRRWTRRVLVGQDGILSKTRNRR